MLLLFLFFECSLKKEEAQQEPEILKTGAEQMDKVLPLLSGKRVALVVNHTAQVGGVHLVDTLRSAGINVVKILAPEHGFRGKADAGEHVNNSMDSVTRLPVISLYGANRKPQPEHLRDVDVIVFDIQDVGARFFTYISTMHYVMEACAENNTKLVVLDRPNPNAYVDGPVLKMEVQSFVGMHPIPVAHGLTVGELARMINGEKWLKDSLTCDLEIVPLKNWKHDDFYSLPLKPSPNLPNDQSIKLYPSLGFFDQVDISVGRGTQIPFQVLGHPDLTDMPFEFTPVSIDGMSKHPPFENKLCHGWDLRNVNVERKVDLQYLIGMYDAFPEKEKFFMSGFDRLAGNKELKEQIKKGMTEAEIRATWADDLARYQEMRKKYLLYD